MAEENQDISMYAGESLEIEILVTNDAGAAKDLTGATIAWKLARGPGSTAMVSKSTGAGIAITNAASGIFTVSLSPADTESLHGRYYHEARVTDSGGKESVITVGTVLIQKSMTN